MHTVDLPARPLASRQSTEAPAVDHDELGPVSAFALPGASGLSTSREYFEYDLSSSLDHDVGRLSIDGLHERIVLNELLRGLDNIGDFEQIHFVGLVIVAKTPFGRFFSMTCLIMLGSVVAGSRSGGMFKAFRPRSPVAIASSKSNCR